MCSAFGALDSELGPRSGPLCCNFELEFTLQKYSKDIIVTLKC